MTSNDVMTTLMVTYIQYASTFTEPIQSGCNQTTQGGFFLTTSNDIDDDSFFCAEDNGEKSCVESDNPLEIVHVKAMFFRFQWKTCTLLIAESRD